MHNPRHHHQPHHHQPHSAHPNPPCAEKQQFNSPPITESDRQLLTELLNNPQEAEEIFGMLQKSPPEVATLGYLVLRILERVEGSLAFEDS